MATAKHKWRTARTTPHWAALTLSAATAAAAQPECVDGLPVYYEVEITQQPCGGPFPAPTHGTGISGSSMVCGSWTDCATANSHAFIWPTAWPGAMQTIPFPPGIDHMQAHDISDAGWVVGEWALEASEEDLLAWYQALLTAGFVPEE